MPLKSLAMTADEAKESMLSYGPTDVKDAPKYPYGTSLDLNDETLKKLGIEKLPAVGEEVTITAIAKVTRISAYEEQEGAEMCCGLQLTQMDITIPSQVKSASDRLYGSAGNDTE